MRTRILATTLALLALALLAAGCNASHGCARDDGRAVTVQGVAEHEVAPDRAVLRLRIHSRAAELAAAKADNDRRLAAVVKALLEHGLTTDDLQTGQIRVSRIYDHRSGEAIPRGFDVTRYGVVTVREIDRYSEVLAAALDAGATDVDGVTFEVEDLRIHRDAARLDAATAAREKATALAEHLGASLGEIVAIDEVDDAAPWRGFAAANSVSRASAEGAVGEGVHPGKVTIRSSVRVSFALR